MDKRRTQLGEYVSPVIRSFSQSMRNSSEFSARMALIGYESLESRSWLMNIDGSTNVLFAPEDLRNLFDERLSAGL